MHRLYQHAKVVAEHVAKRLVELSGVALAVWVAPETPKGTRAAISAAQPLECAPNRVDIAVLRVAMQAPHRLVLAPGVLQAQERPAVLGGTPSGLTAPLAALARSIARAVTAGASLGLVAEAPNYLRGLLRGTR